MKKYFQEKENDCLTAAIATILQIEPSSIPFFFDTENPNEEFKRWMLKEKQMLVFANTYDKKKPYIIDIPLEKYFCIGTLKHDDKKYSHAVVLILEETKDGTTIKIFHDPDKNTNYDISDLVGIEYIVDFKDALTKGKHNGY